MFVKVWMTFLLFWIFAGIPPLWPFGAYLMYRTWKEASND